MSPRAVVPGKPLVWRAGDPTAADLTAELCALIREREAEHRRDLEQAAGAVLACAFGMAQAQDDLEADVRASLQALSTDQVLAQEGLAMRCLERTWAALSHFEERAATDPAGAARALCRWIAKVRQDQARSEDPGRQPEGSTSPRTQSKRPT